MGAGGLEEQKWVGAEDRRKGGVGAWGFEGQRWVGVEGSGGVGAGDSEGAKRG